MNHYFSIIKFQFILITLLTLSSLHATSTLIANAGEDINVTLSPSNRIVTLNGGASTPDTNGTIVKYEWFYDGDSLGTGVTLDIEPPYSGSYIVALVITDSLGHTASDTVKVEVLLGLATSYAIVLKSTKKIAGYEIHLKFTKDTTPKGTLILNNDFLASTGRIVNTLGPDINTTINEFRFGAFSFGNNDGVVGEFIPLSFKLIEGNISIVKHICLNKNANIINCNVQILTN